MKLRAMAKINLGLDVVRKREDGYHDVRMIMQTVGMYDALELTPLNEPEIRITTNLRYLPVNEDNLVYHAAKLLMTEFHIKQGLMIQLEKFIPVSAGMAGGSSDAAAVMFGVNRLFKLGLSKKELMQRGVKIGADVPYCIMRGTALAEGIGERLTALPKVPRGHVLIAKPPISVSTKFVYENLHLEKLQSHPDIDGIRAAIEAGDLKMMAERMGNVLETVTIPAYPQIGKIRDIMLENGALGAMMSGSGPTVFGVFETCAQGKKARQVLKESGLAQFIYQTTFFN